MKAKYTMQDWIDERRVSLDWDLMQRAERFPAMTSTDPNYVPKPEPVRFFSIAELQPEHDWVRDAFLVRAETRFFIR